MDNKLADKVRAIALQKYVEPAKNAGMMEFSIAVKDLLNDLKRTDFPLNYTPLVCNSIKTKSFQRENHLEIVGVEGPKSQTGTRVVVHYRITGDREGAAEQLRTSDRQNKAISETPRERAKRLTGRLRGLLRKELKEFGGADAFIQWVRSDDEDAA